MAALGIEAISFFAKKDKADSPGRRQRPNYLSNIGDRFYLWRKLFYCRFDSGLQRHLVHAARGARALEPNFDMLAFFYADERDVAAV